jgi:hypothetical protein
VILPFLWALIGGARGIIVAAGAAAIVWASLSAFDRLIDDPAVAAAARKDFVARAELEAEKAKSAELVRQLNAGAAAIEEARKQAEADAIAAEETARRTEVEIVAYEKRLAAAGRSCRAHDAPSGWTYPWACCSNMDCQQISKPGDAGVKETSDGYVIKRRAR